MDNASDRLGFLDLIKKNGTENEMTPEIQNEAKTILATNTDKNYAPTVKFIGCGGFGINQIRLLPKTLDYPSVLFEIIDTSEANTHRQEVHPDIKKHLFDVDGRGKVRGGKVNVDQTKVDMLINSDTDEYDIAIVAFSLTGGTGSVFGPLVVNALCRQGKPVVVITVADGGSTVDCTHTIDALQGLQNIALNNKAYVNLLLFDNEVSNLRSVDRSVNNKIEALFRAINLNNIIALDKSDITVAMQPSQHKVCVGLAGLYRMKIDTGSYSADCYDEDQAPIAHSTIVVDSASHPWEVNDLKTSIKFNGSFTQEHMKPVRLVFGCPMPEAFTKRYAQLQKELSAVSKAHITNVELTNKDSKEHSSGLVL